MQIDRWLSRLLLLIGIITVISGAVQMFLPATILEIIGADTGSGLGRHTFAIVGMFMVLFGGLLVQGVKTAPRHTPLILWASLQKLGAAIAVGLGVSGHLFSAIALTVAAFDLFSGILGLWYWKRLTDR